VAGCCECDSEFPRSIKCGEYLEGAAESRFGLRRKTFFGPRSKGGSVRGKVRKQSRERHTQDGRWPQVPAA
jgi:hypothetical protein